MQKQNGIEVCDSGPFIKNKLQVSFGVSQWYFGSCNFKSQNEVL